MQLTLNINDNYAKQILELLATIPKEAFIQSPKPSLSAEINRRVEEYKSGKMKTTPFKEGLDELRAKIASLEAKAC